jgi:hypothetical protein
MEVDEVVDNLANPSTPMKLGSVSPMAQSGMYISDDILDEMYATLGFHIKNKNDEYIKRHLGSIFHAVKEALLDDDRKMEKNLVSTEGFLQNVRQKGEKEFIDLLKDMAEKKSWRDLFENGTSFLSSTLERSDDLLQTYYGSKFPKVLTNHSGASLQPHRTVRNDVEATYIFLIASRYSLPKGVEFHFQRQSGGCTVRFNLELSQQREKDYLYKTYNDCQFVWDGEVPYG